MVICGRADIAFRADLSRAASRWLGCSPHPRRGERRRFRRGNQKGRHLRFLPSWDSRFPLFRSLAQTRDRRPLRNLGTAVGLLLRLFREIFAVHRYLTATHAGYSPQARHTPCRATLLRVTTDSSCGLHLSTNFTAGCGKVNCPSGQEKVPWGATRCTVSKPSAHC